jgi:UDP-N-acetylmuramate dehydrogenase
MLGEIRGEVRFKEPLSFHTSLRVGGPADFFIVPQDVEDIRLAQAFATKEGLPVDVIGGGNNLLVRDRGVRGVVLKLEGCLGRAEFHGEEAVAGAGVTLSALIREAAALNLGGIECLVGIPATIGGAVATNAGTSEGWIGDFVSAAYFLNPDGTLGEFKPGGAFGYRAFAAPRGAVLIGARLRLHRRPHAEVLRDIKARLKQKRSSQPLALASAGCVWRNPPCPEPATRLIERVGLRGKRLNGAEISAKQANFIVNRGGATAGDVLALMDMTRERVQAQFGIALEAEIRVMGEG